jgi:urease subunit gamma
MHLTAREKDELLVAIPAGVARQRLERGVRLNDSKSAALISDVVLEGASDGHGVAEPMRDGAR